MADGRGAAHQDGIQLEMQDCEPSFMGGACDRMHGKQSDACSCDAIHFICGCSEGQTALSHDQAILHRRKRFILDSLRLSEVLSPHPSSCWCMLALASFHQLTKG